MQDWRQYISSALKRISLREILTYLVFVVMGTFMWYGHAMTSVRNAKVHVKLQYTGIPDRVAFDTPLPEQLTIEVRDAGRRLIPYRQDPPLLTIDLSSQFRGKTGEVRISEDVLRRSLTSLLQGTSKLQQVTPEAITATYYTQREKTVNVVLRGTYNTNPEYQIIGQPQISIEKIQIYGNSKQLDTIQHVYTQDITISDIQDTLQQRLAICPIPGIRMSDDSLTLKVLSERVTEKVLTVPIRARHVPSGSHLRLFPKEVTVTMRVSMAHFAEITADDVIVECMYAQTQGGNLPVNIRYTNPAIYSARTNPSVVEFILEKIQSETDSNNTL